MGVTGYADQRPIASNTTAEGKAQNRRVEVLILPSTVRTSVAKTNSATAAPHTASNSKKTANLNKDAIASPDRSPLNK